MFGGVEAGGTKFVCAIGTGPDAILGTTRIEVTDPATTLAAAVRFFRDAVDGGVSLAAIGVASFGPIELRRGHTLAADEAARIILDGMEQNHDRVLVGGDARMLDRLYRLHPRRAAAFLADQMKDLLGP